MHIKNKKYSIYYWNIKSKRKYWINKNWKTNKEFVISKYHSLCPYIATFQPSLANFFIKKYSQKDDLVLDIFCGRGTALLEASLLQRQSCGIDLNPLAYVLTKAKSKCHNKTDLIKQVALWEKEFKKFIQNASFILDNRLLIYYSKHNLIQLTWIQHFYGRFWKRNNEIDNFLLAITLGLMHGPQKKDQSTIYFSVSMSNIHSMSLNYVKNYVCKHNLKYPETNIFQQIKRRIIWIYLHSTADSKFLKNRPEISVIHDDAVRIRNFWKGKSPKIILTSPPYLNIVNYTRQNWIKLWLLDFKTTEERSKIKLNDKYSIVNYQLFLQKILTNIANISNKNTILIFVIGDVVHAKKSFLFYDYWNQVEKKLPWKLKEVYRDFINQKNKSTNSLGTKKGQATMVENIYVFELKK